MQLKHLVDNGGEPRSVYADGEYTPEEFKEACETQKVDDLPREAIFPDGVQFSESAVEHGFWRWVRSDKIEYLDQKIEECKEDAPEAFRVTSVKF